MIRKGKEVKDIQIEKNEGKIFLFIDDMAIYVENMMESIKDLVESIHVFGMVSEYKISLQKLIVFLCTMCKNQK